MKQLVIGKNEYLIFKYKKQIISDFIKDNSLDSVDETDASEVDVQEIENSLQAQSLFNMGQDKLVVLTGLSGNKPALDYVAKNIDGFAVDLLIVDSRLDKRSSLYKNFKKNNNVKEFNLLDENSAISWVVEQAKVLKAELKNADARFLVQRVGADQWALANELEKIALYDSNITKETIELLTIESPDETIFKMLDTLVAGNLQKTLKSVNDLIQTGSEPIYIISMLIWYFHNIAVVKMAGSNMPNDYDLAKQYKMSPFVVGKSRAVANKLPKRDLANIFDLITEADFRQKNVNLNKHKALKALLIEITSIISFTK